MAQRGIIGNILGLLGVLIFVVIGVSLVPTVANAEQAAEDNTNVTGAAQSLVGLSSLIFVALIIVGMVAFFR